LLADVLVAAAALSPPHLRHPEVVGVGPERVDRLAEAQLDLEAIAVEGDHGQWIEGRVGTEQDRLAAPRMADEDEPPDRPPEQILGAVGDPDVLLVVDGAGSGLEAALALETLPEADLSAVAPGAPSAAPAGDRGGPVGHGVAAHPGDEVMALREQGQDHLGARVEGVGHQDHARSELAGDVEEQLHQAVEQRAAQLAGAVDHALVAAGGQGDRGDEPAGAAHEQGRRARAWKEWPSMNSGLELLMELLHRRHLLALFRGLEPIGQADQSPAHFEGGEPSLAEAHPEGREGPQPERFAVEHVQQPQVPVRLQRQRPDDAGDSREIGARAQSHQHDPHPLEGDPPGARGS
jgi:hypothetical protein